MYIFKQLDNYGNFGKKVKRNASLNTVHHAVQSVYQTQAAVETQITEITENI